MCLDPRLPPKDPPFYTIFLWKWNYQSCFLLSPSEAFRIKILILSHTSHTSPLPILHFLSIKYEYININSQVSKIVPFMPGTCRYPYKLCYLHLNRDSVILNLPFLYLQISLLYPLFYSPCTFLTLTGLPSVSMFHSILLTTVPYVAYYKLSYMICISAFSHGPY